MGRLLAAMWLVLLVSCTALYVMLSQFVSDQKHGAALTNDEMIATNSLTTGSRGQPFQRSPALSTADDERAKPIAAEQTAQTDAVDEQTTSPAIEGQGIPPATEEQGIPPVTEEAGTLPVTGISVVEVEDGSAVEGRETLDDSELAALPDDRDLAPLPDDRELAPPAPAKQATKARNKRWEGSRQVRKRGTGRLVFRRLRRF